MQVRVTFRLKLKGVVLEGFAARMYYQSGTTPTLPQASLFRSTEVITHGACTTATKVLIGSKMMLPAGLLRICQFLDPDLDAEHLTRQKTGCMHCA